MTDCRIEFALLPTVCSLPVASHPASRRRSYLQLSGAGLTQVRTFTQLFVCTCRRTRTCRPWRVPWGVRATIIFRFGKPAVFDSPNVLLTRNEILGFHSLTAFPLQQDTRSTTQRSEVGARWNLPLRYSTMPPLRQQSSANKRRSQNIKYIEQVERVVPDASPCGI